MHFALPPRKTSFPPPYARVSAQSSSSHRRKQIQHLGYVVFGILTIYLIFSVFSSNALSSQLGVIAEDASVLIVTVLDEATMTEEYISMIKKNRDDYASRHGYKTFYTNVSRYEHLTRPSPPSWALIPALRHALTLNAEVDYVWSLTPHAIITNPGVSLHQHVFSKLPDLMLKDIPVVPPDSVIHTFSHLKPSQVDLILTQDKDNVAHTSFILRNTEAIPVFAGEPKDSWTQYFLDAWFDPLYRAYAFQKAENHALEHIIQWHPTILARLAIVDQRVLNSYCVESLKGEESEHGGQWHSGDLIINFKGCTEWTDRDCVGAMKHYMVAWQEAVARLDGKAGLH